VNPSGGRAEEQEKRRAAGENLSVRNSRVVATGTPGSKHHVNLLPKSLNANASLAGFRRLLRRVPDGLFRAKMVSIPNSPSVLSFASKSSGPFIPETIPQLQEAGGEIQRPEVPCANIAAAWYRFQH
jgi:hypothetical protein